MGGAGAAALFYGPRCPARSDATSASRRPPGVALIARPPAPTLDRLLEAARLGDPDLLEHLRAPMRARAAGPAATRAAIRGTLVLADGRPAPEAEALIAAGGRLGAPPPAPMAWVGLRVAPPHLVTPLCAWRGGARRPARWR